MNSNSNDIPFNERHDDELLTLEDVARILRTSETPSARGARWAPGLSFFKIGRRLYTTVGGWGKTKGYQNLGDREMVPPPVMTHPTAGDSTSCWRGRRSGSPWPRPNWRHSSLPSGRR